MTTDLEQRLRESVTYKYLPMQVRRELREAADAIARLRAENEAMREAIAPVFAKLEREARGQGPGHCHTVPGIWDDDSSNGEKAGKPCEWCAQWERARQALQEGSRHE